MKKPLINWDVLEEISRPMMPLAEGGRPAGAPGRGLGGWDSQAVFYNKMASMEKEGTLNQINCLDAGPEDTFLDVGCGPGRITVPMAARVKSVTAVDASPKMLELCRKNAAAAGVDNVRTVLMDWEDREAAASLEQHDIVLASRSIGMHDLQMLSRLARKYAVIVIWSYGYPSIPEIMSRLFAGAESDEGAHKMPLPPQRDRRLGNNLFYNRVYDLGYEPNLKIVADGFANVYGSREEAYADLRQLGRNLDPEKDDVFRANADRFISENADGTCTFRADTRTMVMWWNTEGNEEKK